MAGSVTGLHIFQADTGPEPLALLDNNYNALTTPLNSLITFANYYIDSGAAGALIVTINSPQVFGYVDGVTLQVKVAATQTAAGATINVNGLGVKNIVNPDGSTLAANQLLSGALAQLQYSASAGVFQLVGGDGFAYPKLVLGPPSSGITLTVINSGPNQNLVLNSSSASGGYNVFQTAGADVGYWGSGNRVFSGTPADFGITAVGNNNLLLGSNSLARIQISGTGSVTLNTPTSGVHNINTLGQSTAVVIGVQSSGTQSGWLQFNDLTNSNAVRGYVGSGSSLFTGAALGDFGIASANAVLRLSSDAGATTALAISAGGVVTLSKGVQPAFYATENAGQALNAAATTTLIFNTAQFNQSSSYATGTGIFTAPVAGLYLFTCMLWIQNNAAGAATISCWFSVNGGAAGTNQIIPVGFTINAASQQTMYPGSIVLKLNAADTVKINATVGANNLQHGSAGSNQSSFCGYLLG